MDQTNQQALPTKRCLARARASGVERLRPPHGEGEAGTPAALEEPSAATVVELGRSCGQPRPIELSDEHAAEMAGRLHLAI